MNSSDQLITAIANLCLHDYYEFRGRLYPYWNHWGLYLDQKVASDVFGRVASVLHGLTADFDLLCPIPTSGFPLAAVLYRDLKIPMMASFHWRDATFHVEERLKRLCASLGRPPRVCAVDSAIHTGTSLFLCQQMVQERLGGDVTALIAVANNDLVPPELVDPIKRDFGEAGKLHCLYLVSELERHWDRRNEGVIAARSE